MLLFFIFFVLVGICISHVYKDYAQGYTKFKDFSFKSLCAIGVGALLYLMVSIGLFYAFATEDVLSINRLVSLAAPAKNDFLVGLDYDKDKDEVFYIFKFIDTDGKKREFHFDKDKTIIGSYDNLSPSIEFRGRSISKWLSFFNTDGIINKITVRVPDYTTVHEFYD